MAQYESADIEKDAARMVAAMMAVSARTAPKTRGLDAVKTLLLDGDDIELLAGAMEAKGQAKKAPFPPIFPRDAANVRKSACILLVGVTGAPKGMSKPLDCGACGYETCEQLMSARVRQGDDFNGPVCMFQAIDLGIALGSAVKLAGDLNVDNRIMYTIGAAAKQLKLLDSDVIMGIPMSVAGKNIYFDRS